MARAPASGRFKQLNLRVDAELLDNYRDYCAREGLDPHQLVINFLQRVVDRQLGFEAKLWQALTKNR